MNVLIKDFDIPKACIPKDVDPSYSFGYCNFQFFDYHGGSHCSISECKTLKTKRPKGCPLVEIPDVHGDLKDCTAIINAIEQNLMPRLKTNAAREIIGSVVTMLHNAPTVVEASK